MAITDATETPMGVMTDTAIVEKSTLQLRQRSMKQGR